MKRRRLDPGGFAYGELHESEVAVKESGDRGKDAPLSARGKIIGRIVIGLLGAAALATVIVVATST